MLRALAFAALSACIIAISWRSLKVLGSHGFYRFFAWEAIAMLLVLNVDFWFTDPWSGTQVLSWILLFVSAVVVALGVRELRVHGKAEQSRNDGTLMSFEKTSLLVTSGIFRYIRHPLYASLLYLALGIFLKDITWYSFCLVLLATVFLIVTAKADEAECVRYFGSAYDEYMRRTKMFVPFVV